MAKKQKTYLSYSFTGKDPIIERMRGVLAAEKMTYAAAHKASGVATSTLRNWFKGKTRRPQFATIMAAMRGADHDLVVVRRGAKVVPMLGHNSKKRVA